MHVKSLHIYPLKSGKAANVRTLDITPTGPAGDRGWMVVRDHGDKGLSLLSQRGGNEALALVEPILQKDGLSLNAPGMPTLFFDEMELSTTSRPVNIHGDTAAHVFDAGDKAAAWISKFLGKPCRLARQDPAYIRTPDQVYAQESDSVSLADGFPLLITNQASLRKLQQKLPEEAHIDMARFRANIVLEGDEAFEEDVIYELKIGDVVLEMVKPCARCVMITINQRTGEAANQEPLATLAKLRRGKADGLQGVFFGQNAIPRALGRIKVGDPVEILSCRPMHQALEQATLKYEILQP